MTEHRWPPQPGDLVKVEGQEFIMVVAGVELPEALEKETLVDCCINGKSGHWYNLSNLAPATPPETIEQFGRTYRLDEGWQPIETAPKSDAIFNKPKYLGLFDGGRVDVIWWDADRYSKKPRPFWNNSCDHNRVATARSRQPTHWMPLPAPPAREPTP